MKTKISLATLLREMRPGVLPMIPKQNDIVIDGFAKETEVPEVPHQEHIDNFFRLLRLSVQKFRTRGNKSK
jgi:hypothetical protein